MDLGVWMLSAQGHVQWRLIPGPLFWFFWGLAERPESWGQATCCPVLPLQGASKPPGVFEQGAGVIHRVFGKVPPGSSGRDNRPRGRSVGRDGGHHRTDRSGDPAGIREGVAVPAATDEEDGEKAISNSKQLRRRRW